MEHIKSESKQFTDPLLAEAYDSINALGEDVNFWCKEVEKIKPSSIIDFGCGTGLLTCELAKRGYQMVGIDPAGAMLKAAKPKPYAEKVKWIEGGYEKVNGLEADLFLMTSHVAQFLLEDKDWNTLLKNAYQALHPGGYILFDSRRSLVNAFKNWPTEESRRKVTDPALGEIQYWHRMLETTDKRAKYELHYFFTKSGENIISTDEIIFRSYDEIEKSLIDAGFTVEKVYGDWDASEFNQEESPEMIFLARK